MGSKTSLSEKSAFDFRGQFAALGFLSLVAFAAPNGGALADDFKSYSSTNVQTLYGKGFELQPTDRLTTLTLEHYSTWKYGDNYFFVDLYNQGGDNETYYGEWFPSLSLNRIFGLNTGPFIKDVHAVGSINLSENYRVYLAGAGVDLNIPGFDFFRIDGFLTTNVVSDIDSWQITPVWDTTWRFDSKVQVRFRGYMDIVGEGPGGEGWILSDPQLLLDVGNLIGLDAGHLYSGIEYRYWHNKFGVEGVDEHVGQAMVAWFF